MRFGKKMHGSIYKVNNAVDVYVPQSYEKIRIGTALSFKLNKEHILPYPLQSGAGNFSMSVYQKVILLSKSCFFSFGLKIASVG